MEQGSRRCACCGHITLAVTASRSRPPGRGMRERLPLTDNEGPS